MASASCSCTAYIGSRRAKPWAKIRSSDTLSKPKGVRNSNRGDLSRRDGEAKGNRQPRGHRWIIFTMRPPLETPPPASPSASDRAVFDQLKTMLLWDSDNIERIRKSTLCGASL